MTMYTAARTCTYVRRSSLRSCYSESLLSYVPPCTIADTCERCLHMGTATRLNGRMGGGVSEWHSSIYTCVHVYVWAHMRRTANQGQFVLLLPELSTQLGSSQGVRIKVQSHLLSQQYVNNGIFHSLPDASHSLSEFFLCAFTNLTPRKRLLTACSPLNSNQTPLCLGGSKCWAQTITTLDYDNLGPFVGFPNANSCWLANCLMY